MGSFVLTYYFVVSTGRINVLDENLAISHNKRGTVKSKQIYPIS